MSSYKVLLLSQLLLAGAAASKSIRGGNQPRELDTRIIGGAEAEEGRYSYAVSLQDGIGHFCGGSLIAKDVVLSAAHCMQKDRPYKAVIGRHDLGTTYYGEEIMVASEITHPSYDPEGTDNDFMILILDEATTEDVDFVKVSPDIVPVDSAVTVMGWGDTHPSDSISIAAEQLMETEVFVTSNDECRQSSGTIGGMEFMGWAIGGYQASYQDQVTDNMLCAKDYQEDSCQGDSGGPLVVRQSSGEDMQVGVVSWGIGCAQQDFPGVYARVSSQYEWIREQVCKGSSDAPSYFECDRR